MYRFLSIDTRDAPSGAALLRRERKIRRAGRLDNLCIIDVLNSVFSPDGAAWREASTASPWSFVGAFDFFFLFISARTRFSKCDLRGTRWTGVGICETPHIVDDTGVIFHSCCLL